MGFRVLQPTEDVVKGFFSGDVVYKKGACGAAIITARDTSEGLLAGGVPNLKLELLILYCDNAGAEFNADGEIMYWGEAAICELSAMHGQARWGRQGGRGEVSGCTSDGQYATEAIKLGLGGKRNEGSVQ